MHFRHMRKKLCCSSTYFKYIFKTLQNFKIVKKINTSTIQEHLDLTFLRSHKFWKTL